MTAYKLTTMYKHYDLLMTTHIDICQVWVVFRKVQPQPLWNKINHFCWAELLKYLSILGQFTSLFIYLLQFFTQHTSWHSC